MQVISVFSVFITIFLLLMNYHNHISINLLSKKFALLMGLSQHTLSFDLAIYTFGVFILGILSVIFFFVPLYSSLKEKFNAYKRELERGSISNTSAEAKIGVLENKIGVLEKALEDALKKSNGGNHEN